MRISRTRMKADGKLNSSLCPPRVESHSCWGPLLFCAVSYNCDLSIYLPDLPLPAQDQAGKVPSPSAVDSNAQLSNLPDARCGRRAPPSQNIFSCSTLPSHQENQCHRSILVRVSLQRDGHVRVEYRAVLYRISFYDAKIQPTAP